MLNTHKLFIEYYCKPENTSTFLNASASYAKVFPNAKNCYINSDRLYKRLKNEIELRIKALCDISLSDYVGLLNKEYLNAQNKDSVRLRALELLGKCKAFLKENDINLSNTTVNVSQEDIKSRIEAKRQALSTASKQE